MGKIKVFVSYSQKDREVMLELLEFLSTLEDEGFVFWSDLDLTGGQKWDQVIQEKVASCHIALVLVSQYFLNSAYCREKEIGVFLAQNTWIFPVLVSPCDLKSHPWLAERQYLPSGKKTIHEDYSKPGLREALFLEILEQLRKLGQGLNTKPDPPAPSTSAGTGPAGLASAPSSGTTFAYTRLEELGHGGMGIVYKGLDEKLNRTVAIKFINPVLATDAKAKARFLREARCIAALDHPRIVHIYEVGEHQGQPYFVMQYVEGGSLEQLLQQGPMTPPRAARMLAQVADGLACAHEHGIVHRDLKPANILVGGGDNVRLADFGVASFQAGEKLTQTGTAQGTLGYQAPEVMTGQMADARSDIYGLGMVYFEMLTGQKQFVTTSLMQLLRQIADGEVRSPRSVNPAIDEPSEAIFWRMAANEPSKRYPTCRELVADLERYLNSPRSVPELVSVGMNEPPRENVEAETHPPPVTVLPEPKASLAVVDRSPAPPPPSTSPECPSWAHHLAYDTLGWSVSYLEDGQIRTAYWCEGPLQLEGSAQTLSLGHARWMDADAFRILRSRGIPLPKGATELGVDAYGVWSRFVHDGQDWRMRLILPDQFQMGSPETEFDRGDDELQHMVVLTRPYWLGETTVTQKVWMHFMGQHRCQNSGPLHPVERVTWPMCHGFIDAINVPLVGGFRLPSEAEWEFACRAGTTTCFSFGDRLTTDIANYNGRAPYADGPQGQSRNSQPAKRFDPNPWGLYQMHGNVREWCLDDARVYSKALVVNPVGPLDTSNRIVRGGSWVCRGTNLRSAARYSQAINTEKGNIGLRLARDF